jgi:hypothetical protein
LVEILQVLLMQGHREDGTLSTIVQVLRKVWGFELNQKGLPRKRGIQNGRQRKTVATQSGGQVACHHVDFRRGDPGRNERHQHARGIYLL